MTRKKRVGIFFLTMLIFIAVSGISVYWALKQVPDFYEEALVAHPDPEVRRESAKKFVQQSLQLVEDVKHSNQWSQEFTEEQINSWLTEDFPRQYADSIPQEISNPRIRLTQDTILIGFKVHQKKFRGVISLKLKPWVTDDQKLAIEIVSIKAGLVPIPVEEALERVAEQIAEFKQHIQWTRANGNDVLILDLAFEDQHHPILQTVQVADGIIRISGINKEPSSGEQSQRIPRLAEFPLLRKSKQ